MSFKAYHIISNMVEAVLEHEHLWLPIKQQLKAAAVRILAKHIWGGMMAFGDIHGFQSSGQSFTAKDFPLSVKKSTYLKFYKFLSNYLLASENRGVCVKTKFLNGLCDISVKPL